MSKIEIDTIINGVTKVVGNENIQKMVLGTYSDGKPRSFGDCLSGELLSPSDKKKVMYGEKKKKKKKKNKKKKIKMI